MKGKGNSFSLPDYDFNSVTDYYTMFVSIMGCPEDVFWYCDIGFVKRTCSNRQVYEKWMNRQRELLENGKK